MVMFAISGGRSNFNPPAVSVFEPSRVSHICHGHSQDHARSEDRLIWVVTAVLLFTSKLESRALWVRAMGDQ
jgi:hypothetical protein